MNRAHINILGAVTIIWASVLLPTRAKAAHGTNTAAPHQIHHAIVEGGATTSGEQRASQMMSQLLPDIPGKQVVVLAITYPPGYSGAVHRHNAHVFAYVLQGSVVMGLKDGAPVTLTQGQIFCEGPRDIHTISRNLSKTKPAKILVFLIKDKDAPITVGVK